MSYEPHRWHYDPTNGFWAHCNCGFSSASIADFLLRRRMDRHVREATELALMESTIRKRSLTREPFLSVTHLPPEEKGASESHE